MFHTTPPFPPHKKKKKNTNVTNTLLPEKTGLARLFEALEANEWAATATATADDDGDGDGDFDGSSGSPDLLFGVELDSNEDELGAALLDEFPPKGKEQKAEDGGEDEGDRQVLELERMMTRMQAVKGKPSIHELHLILLKLCIADEGWLNVAIGQDMPHVARKRFAAKAVRDILGSVDF